MESQIRLQLDPRKFSMPVGRELDRIPVLAGKSGRKFLQERDCSSDAEKLRSRRNPKRRRDGDRRRRLRAATPGFSSGAIPPAACATGRMLRARNDSKPVGLLATFKSVDIGRRSLSRRVGVSKSVKNCVTRVRKARGKPSRSDPSSCLVGIRIDA